MLRLTKPFAGIPGNVNRSVEDAQIEQGLNRNHGSDERAHKVDDAPHVRALLVAARERHIKRERHQ